MDNQPLPPAGALPPSPTPPPSPPLAQPVPGLEPTQKPFSLASLILPCLLIIVLAAAAFFAWTFYLKNQLSPTGKTQATPAPTPSSATKPSTDTSWIYLKGDNVFLYATAQARQQPLTSDGDQPKVWYQRPQFVNKDQVSYVRCSRAGDNPTDTDPYACALTLHDLTTSQTKSVFSLSSVQNQNNFPVAGTIEAYDWNQTGDQFIALTQEGQKDGTSTVFKVHHFQLATNTDTVIFEHTPFPGRGGSLDDQIALNYSLDDSQALLVLTPLLPSPDSQSSIFIFDTVTPKTSPIWTYPGHWTTFAHWLEDKKLIAKSGTSSGSNYFLITIDPTEVSPADLDQAASDWYSFVPITDTAFVYYTLKKGQQTGINLNTYDVSATSSAILESNLFPVKYLGDNLLAVRTARNCSALPDGCGMDLYNGVQLSGFAVYDLASRKTQTIPITQDDIPISDFDAISL